MISTETKNKCSASQKRCTDSVKKTSDGFKKWVEEKDPKTGKPYKICKFCCQFCTRKNCLISLAVFLLVLFILYITCPIWPVPFANYAESRKTDGIIIYCERTVKDPVEYKTAFDAYAEFTQSGGSGVYAMFSFMSMEAGKENRALQFFLFSGMAGFASQPQNSALSSALWAEYAGTPETDFCQVMGGWTEEMKSLASTLPGVHYSFEKPFGGFIRDPATTTGSKAYSMDGPLMIFMSKRLLKPGKKVFDAYGPAFTHLADIMWTSAPGVIASIEVPDGRDPEGIWVARVFNDYTLGFLAHLYGSPLTTPTVLMTVMPYWQSPIFPIANSFSNAWMMNAAIAGFPGNAVYKQYHYEENLIGPMPDLKKAVA